MLFLVSGVSLRHQYIISWDCWGLATGSRRHRRSAFWCQPQCQGCAWWGKRSRVIWMSSSPRKHEELYCGAAAAFPVQLKRDHQDWEGQNSTWIIFNWRVSSKKQCNSFREFLPLAWKPLRLTDGCSFSVGPKPVLGGLCYTVGLCHT